MRIRLTASSTNFRKRPAAIEASVDRFSQRWIHAQRLARISDKCAMVDQKVAPLRVSGGGKSASLKSP